MEDDPLDDLDSLPIRLRTSLHERSFSFHGTPQKEEGGSEPKIQLRTSFQDRREWPGTSTVCRESPIPTCGTNYVELVHLGTETSACAEKEAISNYESPIPANIVVESPEFEDTRKAVEGKFDSCPYQYPKDIGWWEGKEEESIRVFLLNGKEFCFHPYSKDLQIFSAALLSLQYEKHERIELILPLRRCVCFFLSYQLNQDDGEKYVQGEKLLTANNMRGWKDLVLMHSGLLFEKIVAFIKGDEMDHRDTAKYGDTCWMCGETGHWQDQCPQANSVRRTLAIWKEGNANYRALVVYRNPWFCFEDARVLERWIDKADEVNPHRKRERSGRIVSLHSRLWKTENLSSFAQVPLPSRSFWKATDLPLFERQWEQNEERKKSERFLYETKYATIETSPLLYPDFGASREEETRENPSQWIARQKVLVIPGEARDGVGANTWTIETKEWPEFRQMIDPRFIVTISSIQERIVRYSRSFFALVEEAKEARRRKKALPKEMKTFLQEIQEAFQKKQKMFVELVADYGSGKTQLMRFLSQMFPDKRYLLLTPTVCLGREAARDFQFAFYKDFPKTKEGQDPLHDPKIGSIVITLESLLRLRNVPFDVVFFDEFLTEMFRFPSKTLKQKRQETFHELLLKLHRADIVFFSDADLTVPGDVATDVLRLIYQELTKVHPPGEQPIPTKVLRMVYESQKTQVICKSFVETFLDLLLSLGIERSDGRPLVPENLLADCTLPEKAKLLGTKQATKRVAVCFTKASTAHIFMRFVQTTRSAIGEKVWDDEDLIVIFQGNKYGITHRRDLKSKDKYDDTRKAVKDADMVITTPLLGVGCNFFEHQIDEVYLFAEPNGPSTNATLQMLKRFRDTNRDVRYAIGIDLHSDKWSCRDSWKEWNFEHSKINDEIVSKAWSEYCGSNSYGEKTIFDALRLANQTDRANYQLGLVALAKKKFEIANEKIMDVHFVNVGTPYYERIFGKQSPFLSLRFLRFEKIASAALTGSVKEMPQTEMKQERYKRKKLKHAVGTPQEVPYSNMKERRRAEGETDAMKLVLLYAKHPESEEEIERMQKMRKTVERFQRIEKEHLDSNARPSGGSGWNTIPTQRILRDMNPILNAFGLPLIPYSIDRSKPFPSREWDFMPDQWERYDLHLLACLQKCFSPREFDQSIAQELEQLDEWKRICHLIAGTMLDIRSKKRCKTPVSLAVWTVNQVLRSIGYAIQMRDFFGIRKWKIGNWGYFLVPIGYPLIALLEKEEEEEE